MAGWTSVVDMEIRQYLGNKSLRICVSLEVCVCVFVCVGQALKSSQMGVLFSISLFLTLLLQGQRRLHLCDSLSLLSTHSVENISVKGISLHYISHFLFAFLHCSDSFFLDFQCIIVLKLDVHWLQVSGKQVLRCFLNFAPVTFM